MHSVFTFILVHITSIFQPMNMDIYKKKKYFFKKVKHCSCTTQKIKIYKTQVNFKRQVHSSRSAACFTLKDPNRTWLRTTTSLFRRALIHERETKRTGTIFASNNIYTFLFLGSLAFHQNIQCCNLRWPSLIHRCFDIYFLWPHHYSILIAYFKCYFFSAVIVQKDSKEQP